ncbi:MAG: glycosyltransferase family 9 protein [Acidipila sp.]|nr:glycosyltransferase family 9 protein [Acidipila sp.]
MAEDRYLLVRLSSMGDILHALPAASALRTSFPAARLDWLVAEKWQPLVAAFAGLDTVIPLRRFSWPHVRKVTSQLRANNYTCAIDFQGLYKSALLARLSGATRRVGFGAPAIRERGAVLFYTEQVVPAAKHVVDQNLALAAHLGARPPAQLPAGDAATLFPLRIPPEAESYASAALSASGVTDYFVLSPGGGWKSKCWPAERYGQLHRRLAKRLGYPGVVSFGPGERDLAEAVRLAAGEPQPLLLEMDVLQLAAMLRRVKIFIGGDSGPLHLAGAVGAPVVGIYGPTDPARNGPYFPSDVSVRNATPAETTHHRGNSISPAMLSISVEQVEEAVVQRLTVQRLIVGCLGPASKPR